MIRLIRVLFYKDVQALLIFSNCNASVLQGKHSGPVESLSINPEGNFGTYFSPSDGQKYISFSSADADETDIRTITSLHVNNLSIPFFLLGTN